MNPVEEWIRQKDGKSTDCNCIGLEGVNVDFMDLTPNRREYQLDECVVKNWFAFQLQLA